MEREFIEGNKKMAIFMDYEYTPRPIPIQKREYAEKQFGWTRKMKWHPVYLQSMDHKENPLERYHLAYTNDTLKFHSSWEWLMPVIHKCWEVTIEDERQFRGLTLFELSLFTPIEDVWSAVVEFIEWYNL